MISSQAKNNKTFVNSASSVTPFGLGRAPLWKALTLGQSKIENGKSTVSEELHQKVLRHLKDHSRFQTLSQTQRDLLTKYDSIAWSLYSTFTALDDAGWDSLDSKTGLIMATTTGLIPFWEKPCMAHLKDGSPQEDPMYIPSGEVLDLFYSILGAKGPKLMLASACSASTQALGVAHQWIKKEEVQRCIVVGFEKICDLTFSGFDSLQLLSPENGQPFDENRQGINLSEGAASFCLSINSENALAQILGSGFTSDANHMTAPHPEGKGCLESMRMSLKSAQLMPHDVDWVHAHGTGSKHNDRSESIAIEKLELKKSCTVTSTKSYHGHALGASGAIESLICIEALQNQTYIPNFNLNKIDPEIQIPLQRELEVRPMNVILKNTLGFGGVNASLVFSRTEFQND